MPCPQCQTETASEAQFCHQCGVSLMATLSAPGSLPAGQPHSDAVSRLYAVLPFVISLLQHERRVTYRMLRDAFRLDDALLAEIRETLSFRQLAHDEDGRGLVWAGETLALGPSTAVVAPTQPDTVETTQVPSTANPALPSLVTPATPEINGSTAALPELTHMSLKAERRQLTVMFCDLVGSTDLSGKLDPEDLREVIRAYQETAADVIERYEGHIAQYLGDGLLIYFGFPVAHEDDAQRAIHTGLGIPRAMTALNRRLESGYGVQLAVRIGIHTGPVVVGEMGGGGRHENLALGETPNIAARLEGLATPNTVMVSQVTARLVRATFDLENLGPQALKGVPEPMVVFRVLAPRHTGHNADAPMPDGEVFLVGRSEEIGLLRRRWEQSKEGLGQVVLITGEAGIGKSSLVESLWTHVRREGLPCLTLRCLSYYRHSTFYPIIVHLENLLGFDRHDSDEAKLAKLEAMLHAGAQPLEDVVPLFAGLLSVSLPEGRYPALTSSPQQQMQHTHDALAAWMLEETEQQPLLVVWEDLHWADPSTLDQLGLLVDQAPTAAILHVLAFRPDFTPSWPLRSHMTPLTLNHLERPQVERLVAHLAGGKALPTEVVQHIVAKTDGVPLYVEELTKTLLESDFLREEADHYQQTQPLAAVAIPTTLQDSLMARLDRFPTVREVAQLGAVLGREFAYDMLQVLVTLEESTLQDGLARLVDTELLYQRGRPPRAKYIFKHALVRDAAYASLLKRTRQHVHKQVARLLETRFPEVVDMQPELIAYHYTEAGSSESAIDYWQRAGQRALQRWANPEAIGHFKSGLELLATLPQTPERAQQELALLIPLGQALMVTQGQGAPEVEHIYAQARERCRRVEETPQLFPVLAGLCGFYVMRGAMQTARELGEQLLRLAQGQEDPARRIEADQALGSILFHFGELPAASTHLARAMTVYGTQPPDSPITLGSDPRSVCLSFIALIQWLKGYPNQARAHIAQAIALAQKQSNPFSVAQVLCFTATLYQYCRDGQTVKDRSKATIMLSTEQAFPLWTANGTILQGWALAEQGELEDGIVQIRQGLSAWQDIGSELMRPYYLALLAASYGQASRTAEGLKVLDEALSTMHQSGERLWEAELYRLKGDLLLKRLPPDKCQAEICFQQALDVSRRQQAKSLELRVATSMACLWQSQDKHQDAYDLLAPVYEWFTEGFDTADLKDAKALLDALRE